MRIAYSIAQKAEAIALVRVVGVEAAAGQLGIARTTLVKWTTLAGHRPEIDTDGWQRLHDLAVAKTTTAVASGSLPARTVEIIAGIAARNLRPARTVVTVDPADDMDPEPLTTAARDRFTAWIEALPDDDRRAVKLSIHQELNRRAAEGDPGSSDALATDADGAARWDAIRQDMAADLPGIAASVAAADVLEAARRRQRELAARWLDDDQADLLTEAARALGGDQRTVQAGADPIVAHLAETGMLRQRPARTMVQHVVRNGGGQITAIVEGMEQVER